MVAFTDGMMRPARRPLSRGFRLTSFIAPGLLVIHDVPTFALAQADNRPQQFDEGGVRLGVGAVDVETKLAADRVDGAAAHARLDEPDLVLAVVKRGLVADHGGKTRRHAVGAPV